MARAPDWSYEEFRILMNNCQLSDEELTLKLPNRSKGAIGAVRAGVHSYHTGGIITMLSQIMLNYLKNNRSSLTCPRCGAKF